MAKGKDVIYFTCSLELRDELTRVAKARRISRAELIREALDFALIRGRWNPPKRVDFAAVDREPEGPPTHRMFAESPEEPGDE